MLRRPAFSSISVSEFPRNHEAPAPTRSSGTSASSEKSIRASTSASASISRLAPGSRRGRRARPEICRKACAPLRLGLGARQVGQALDRGEVEPAVLEGAAGELARLRRPQARRACRAPRAPRRSPRGRRAVAARPCPRRSRCSARETTAPAPRRCISPVAGSRTPRAARAARLGQLPASALSASPARGPEMRTTAIAAGGRPEERAKMVSEEVTRALIAQRVRAAFALHELNNSCQRCGCQSQLNRRRTINDRSRTKTRQCRRSRQRHPTCRARWHELGADRILYRSRMLLLGRHTPCIRHGTNAQLEAGEG